MTKTDFSDYFDDLLRTNYPRNGSNIPILLDRFTRTQINGRAAYLGLRVDRFEPVWGVDVTPSSEWCSWFSGLFDGEGCLLLATGKRDGGLFPYCGVRIRLRSDDYQVLEEVHKKLMIGTLTTYKAQNERSGDTSVWNVTRTANLKGIIFPLFDRYPLRTKKRLEWPLWKEAVNICLGKRQDKLDRLQEIMEEIRIGRKGASRS